MKRHRFIVGLVLLLLVVFVLLFWARENEPKPPQSDAPSNKQSVDQSPPASEEAQSRTIKEAERNEQEKRRSLVEEIGSMLNTSITFYGKVVDQHGEPVPDASVSYGLLDKFNESGSVGKSKADKNGNIRISGVRGAVISVSVHKDGYYHIHELSKGSFAFGYGTDSYTKPPPTRDNPAVFVLHKMGETESLVVAESRTFRIQKDGTPVTIDLETGMISNAGQLKVQAWTAERDPEGPRFFDWRCRVSVSGGGLIEREGQFDFEAPAEGYREFDEIVMPKDAERWHSQQERHYFVQLPDGRYARVYIRMIAGGNHYFIFESYLNPKPGSRNLEYDPAMRILP